MKAKRCAALALAAILSLALLAGCSGGAPDTPDTPAAPDVQQPDKAPETGGEHTVTVSGDVTGGEVKVDLSQLAADAESTFEGRYSVINNWPTKKFESASGVLLAAVLKAAGAPDDFGQVTVCSTDGYKMSFTREQVLAQRYCFPGLMEDDASGALDAPMVLALSRAEDGGEPEQVKTTLVFGQEDIFEHNSPAFVEDVTSITVSAEDPGSWEPAYAFPAAGSIARGERVKLQHDYSGLVKMYYTTDGSDPTAMSAMYNPSTYQPELNVPITIDGDTVIKVLVRGYGRADSEIAELSFTAVG